MKNNINIFGAGCAGFSFIKYAKILKNFKINLYEKSNSNLANHFWGFWRFKETEDAFKLSKFHWNYWKIINFKNEKIFHSTNHPYSVIEKKKWFEFCKSEANYGNVRILKKKIYQNKNFYHFDKALKFRDL